MTRALLVLIAITITSPLLSQYYLRGEVRDQQGHPLGNVRINLFSKGNFPFYSGSGGAFGIPTSLKVDTITFTLDGYEQMKAPIKGSSLSAEPDIFILKMTAMKANSSKLRLSSVTKNLLTNKPYFPSDNGESYSSSVENEFVVTRQFPETGFALNVDRASYSNIRRFLNINSKAPPEAVRIEEMLNYFNFRSKKPVDKKENFSINTTVTSCPWNDKNELLFINLTARKISLEKTPPSNLVFLIDVSGSMDMPNRLPLLKSAFKLLTENLRAVDTVSIITYANGVSIMLQPTSGSQKQKIIEAIEGLTPSGSTSGEAAIRTAYKFAERSFIEGGNNRVILATDGDFNVGLTSEKELEELITKQRQTGIYLTCLGVGMGNYKDSKLEAMAKRGNGNFAYLDNEHEAEKVLVEEFAQTLFTIANDVYLNVDFNPAMVKEYRLVGFDNKQTAIADSVSELEGGEIGSGHSLLSVFEIVPTDMNNSMYKLPNNPHKIATLNLTYKLPESAEPVKQTFAAPLNYAELERADSSLRFAASVVMFGSMLKQSTFAKDVTFEQVQGLAVTAAESTNRLQMEFIELVQKAKKIYGKKKRKGTE